VKVLQESINHSILTWMLETGGSLVGAMALVGVHQRATDVHDDNLTLVGFHLNIQKAV
jgi:hypothetical protein